jgi:hypothetical protein
MNRKRNRLSAFVSQKCTDNLICRWVDFLMYRLRLEIDDQKKGTDYRNGNGEPSLTAAEADTYDRLMQQFRLEKAELLKEMIRANRGADEFEKRCDREPGYFESLCE